MKIFKHCVALISLLFLGNPVFATVGLAEWQLNTPGGNHIGHFDPYADHGTVIISRNHDEPQLYVVKIVRWQYFKGFIAGEADHGFFLFDEKSKNNQQFSTKEQLSEAIANAKLGHLKSKWLTPQSGWEKTWGKVKVTKIKKHKTSK